MSSPPMRTIEERLQDNRESFAGVVDVDALIKAGNKAAPTEAEGVVGRFDARPLDRRTNTPFRARREEAAAAAAMVTSLKMHPVVLDVGDSIGRHRPAT